MVNATTAAAGASLVLASGGRPTQHDRYTTRCPVSQTTTTLLHHLAPDQHSLACYQLIHPAPNRRPVQDPHSAVRLVPAWAARAGGQLSASALQHNVLQVASLELAALSFWMALARAGSRPGH